ncbi:MAG: hypothetical protein JWP21_2709 [Tardiphaga sp.]|jgi:hypothetical protein|nr:hypothetical protein [Tardiphaga sp.]
MDSTEQRPEPRAAAGNYLSSFESRLYSAARFGACSGDTTRAMASPSASDTYDQLLGDARAQMVSAI